MTQCQQDLMANRVAELDRRIRRQGRFLWALAGVAAVAGLAAFQSGPSKPTVVRLEQPVKVVLEDIGYAIRSNHPIPVKQK